MKNSLLSKNLYSQHTDFLIIKTLLPFITRKTFVDVGAEKGSFAQFLLQEGFQGLLFEPCPNHHAILHELVQNVPARFFPFAIDSTDREADFYINCDEQGEPTDYFHSLCYVANDPRIRHHQKIRVTCRCLRSLLQEGILDKQIGLLKIDTEGNDLQVLRGIGDVRPEVLICEFFTQGIYSGWEEGDPDGLIAEAKNLGFRHYLAIKRYRLSELVSWNPAVFFEQQWGNLIFLNDHIYSQAFQELQKHVLSSERYLFTAPDQLTIMTEEKEQVIQEKEQVIQEKEQVIQELHVLSEERLNIIYYLESHPLRTFLKHWLPHNIQDKIRRIRRGFQPKLGRFYQYAPIPLNIPKQYYFPAPLSQQSLPVVSIITPSWNQAPFVERTIKSVLDQNYTNLEYIIQDGASTDETTQILEKYRLQLRHVESCQDNGQAHAINLGFRHASGDIMVWLNSDDLLLPGAVAYIVKFFLDHPEVDVVYGHRIVINEDEKEIGRWILPPHDDKVLLWADYIPQETIFWRRRIWERAGGYLDESYHFALDWELLLRFREAGASFVRLPHFLAAFRVHDRQKTSKELEKRGFQEMYRLRERCHGRHVSHEEAHYQIRSYMRKQVIYDTCYRLGVLRY